MTVEPKVKDWKSGLQDDFHRPAMVQQRNQDGEGAGVRWEAQEGDRGTGKTGQRNQYEQGNGQGAAAKG
jgi:hypothetical protein